VWAEWAVEKSLEKAKKIGGKGAKGVALKRREPLVPIRIYS